MATTIAVYPRLGTTYLDAHDVPITSAGATVPLSAYIETAIRNGDLLTYDPLEIFDPEDRSDDSTGAAAPVNAQYIVAAANGTLTNELVLTAGTGISLTPGAGTMTIAAPGGSAAPPTASYVTLSANGTLTAERVLTAGSGISIVDGGANSTVTISATGGGGGGAPTTASYVTLGLDPELTAERVLTAGTGIQISDGGANGNVTISSNRAPNDVSYITLGTDGTLTNERVLAAGTGISLSDGGAGGSLTINNTGAPVNAEYLVGSANGTLTNERVLTAGSGITLTPGAGTLTVASTAGGAPSTATYVCLATDATLTNERVLTAGTNISIVDGGAGSTLTISSTGGGSGLTGVMSVLDQGVVQGALANNTARATNRSNFNAAIALAASTNKLLIVPPGDYEIHGGALLVTSSYFRWLGGTNSRIIQYQLNVPVIHCGDPLGTAGTTIEGLSIDGAYLRYAGTGSAGANALELVGAFMCSFANLQIGDPNQGASGATSVPRIGVYCDPTAGTIPCFSCKFSHIRIKNFVEYGWHQYRNGFDAATGNHYDNIYISAGGAGDVRDITAVNGIPAYFGSIANSTFNQFNIEWSTAKTALHMEVVRACAFQSCNIEGITLKNTGAADSGVVSMYQSQAVFSGCMIQNVTFNSANNLTNPSMFRLQDFSCVSLDTFYPTNNSKSGLTLALVRNWDGSGNQGVSVNLRNISLGDNDQLDLIDGFTFSSGNDGHLFGDLSDFNNSSPLTLANSNVTRYPYRTPGVLRMSPSGGNKTVTLARQMTSTNATRIPRGVRRLIRCETGSASSVVVVNYNAAAINGGTTLAAGTQGEFVFDGTDWVRVA